MPATFIRWDVTKGLGMEESARVYLNACAEEDLGDGGLIRAALNDIARFPNMTPLACQVQNHLMLLSGNSSVSLNACSVSDGEKLHMASKGGLGNPIEIGGRWIPGSTSVDCAETKHPLSTRPLIYLAALRPWLGPKPTSNLVRSRSSWPGLISSSTIAYFDPVTTTSGRQWIPRCPVDRELPSWKNVRISLWSRLIASESELNLPPVAKGLQRVEHVWLGGACFHHNPKRSSPHHSVRVAFAQEFLRSFHQRDYLHA